MGSAGVGQTGILRLAPTTAIPADVTCPATLHEHRASADPDGLCWVFGDRRWSWSDAWHDISRFAGALRAEGVVRGDRIAFISQYSPALVVAMHAASLIGAANVVVDPHLTADEMTYVLEHSGARVVFVGHEQFPRMQQFRHELVSVEKTIVMGGDHDELTPWIAAGEPIGRMEEVTPHDACVVRYTSGTTGRPKAVVLTQHNLLVHTRNALSAFEYDDGDVMLLGKLMFHSCALLSAATGMAGIVVDKVDASQLAAAIDAGLTHAFLHTTAFVELHADPRVRSGFGRLKYLAYGSSPIAVPLLEAALRASPETRFVQVYGMNEAVALLTTLDDADHRDPAHPERLMSCGRPIRGVEIRVVNPETRDDVAPGAVGELWFRTEQTTPGYLAEPAATAELIVDGWLRSGDIGRVDGEGFVFLEDRIKDVIKAGLRSVYSAEVERVLARHPEVLDQAVIGIPDDRLGESVHAIVVIHPGRCVSPEQLIAFAHERLASYKVPATVDVVASLPRNASGKVLKRHLRAPYWADRQRPI
ncbi:AMP-binding protein [Aeromicrobium sp.]|uniref:AMP-binding protein n=1 Tax=Aeromicrobium sp. TaxID=1871063 RepID=UPI003C3A86A8